MVMTELAKFRKRDKDMTPRYFVVLVISSINDRSVVLIGHVIILPDIQGHFMSK